MGSARGAMAAFSSFSEMPNVGRWLYRSSAVAGWLTGSVAASDDEALTSAEPGLYGCSADSQAVELCVNTFLIGAASYPRLSHVQTGF